MFKTRRLCSNPDLKRPLVLNWNYWQAALLRTNRNARDPFDFSRHAERGNGHSFAPDSLEFLCLSCPTQNERTVANSMCCHAESIPQTRAVAIVLLVLFAISSPNSTAAQDSITSEYRSKATFLATFPSFVDWPDGAFPSLHSPFIVCVLGDFRFGTTLAEVSRDSIPHGRRVSVRWIRNDQQLRGCHILFVSSSELSRYSKVIALVQGTNTFTVGETTDFLSAGGMLSISFEHEAIQFEVNLGLAKEAHFHVSSKLLALARRVVDPTQSTRS